MTSTQEILMAYGSRRVSHASLCALAVLAVAPAAALAQPRITNLRELTGYDSVAVSDLSRDGSVAVGHYNANATAYPQPFRWSADRGFEALRVPGYLFPYTVLTSSNGRYLVASTSMGPVSLLIRWGPDGEAFFVDSLSPCGVISTIGVSDDGRTIVYVGRCRSNGPWIWREGEGTIELASPACSAFDVGSVEPASLFFVGGTMCNSVQSPIWARPGASGAFNLPPHATGGFASGVSTNGRFVVGEVDFPGSVPARWTDFGPPELLPLAPGSVRGYAQHVSDDGGVVVGVCVTPDYYAHTVRWTAEGGTRYLETELTDLGVEIPTYFVGFPDAMSADGSALASYSVVVQGLPCTSVPRIVSQPVDSPTCFFDLATLHVEAEGLGFERYQWQGLTDDGAWRDLNEVDFPLFFYSGDQSPTLRMALLESWIARDYRCIVSNNCGSAISQPAAIRFRSRDLNQDGHNDAAEVALLINVIAGGPNPQGIDPDINNDGAADQLDIAALVNWIAGGGCP